MSNNFFSNAYKYRETQDTSQLENFTTEAFVFILRYLIVEYPDLALDILALFGFLEIKKSDLEKIHVDTQQRFSPPEDFSDVNKIPQKQQYAIPDITIWMNPDELIFIEVKVDAGLNEYKSKNGKTINQVDFYKNIKDCKDVYVLSKHYIDIENNNIRWFTIYEKLKNNKSFIIKEFLSFLKENGMGERIMLDKNALNVLNSIEALTSLLKNSWEKSGIKKYKLNGYSYITEYGFGYYILKDQEKIGAAKETNIFIGISKVEGQEEYSQKITLWTNDMHLAQKNKDKLETFDNDDYFLSKKCIDLNELIKLKSVDDQETKITRWINEMVKPLLN